MSTPTKYRVNVEVKCTYVSAQSDPNVNRYFFAYTITVTNNGCLPATLKNRHWIIKDATGKVTEVRGAGVVGQQPHLAPGKSFQYTSGAVIETPVGTMHGSYQMVADDGTLFDTDIPQFMLAMPRTLH